MILPLVEDDVRLHKDIRKRTRTFYFLIIAFMVFSTIVLVVRFSFSSLTEKSSEVDDFFITPPNFQVDSRPSKMHQEILPNGEIIIPECPSLSKHVVFWKYIEEDISWHSPYETLGPKEKFLLFEPDEGGWNNLRLGFEASLALAYATGRTFVLPPKGRIYLLDKGKNGEKVKDRYKRPIYGFDDIFEIKDLKAKIPLLTTEEFIMKVHFEDVGIPKPPTELVRLAAVGSVSRGDLLTAWIESFSHQPLWDPSSNFVAFPMEPGTGLSEDDEKKMKTFKKRKREPIVYDQNLINQKSLFFPQCHGTKCRMLVQFHSFLYFADRELDRKVKRLIRDNVHYNSKILCTAGKIIDLLIKDSKHEHFSSAHIRRNDFQYDEARHAPLKDIHDVLWRNINIQGETLYIATDETKREAFNEMFDHFSIKLLGDFVSSADLGNVDPNFLGMIEQVVVSRGRVFVGTWWSTFSGYINRMRGYMEKEQQSFYYPKAFEKEMLRYKYPEGLGWWRAWPTAWRYEDEPL